MKYFCNTVFSVNIKDAFVSFQTTELMRDQTFVELVLKKENYIVG